jgi:hypothetical protein
MNHPLIKKSIPHLIAIAVFLIVSLLYCMPAIKGKVLQQDDVSKWEGAFQDSKNYAAKHDGQYPLWNKNMFGGMPNFQIGGTNGGFNVLGYVHQVLTLNLPKPVNFFFLACICFYILACCLRINPWVGIITAVGYGFATYNPIIVAVGHDTKMLAIAYMPALLGSVYLILQKKYVLGGVLTIVFSGLMVLVNHVQIFYYLLLAMAIMAIFYAVQYILNKEFKHMLVSFAIAALAIVIGVGSNAQLLMSSFEYQKETQRGGSSQLTDTAANAAKSTGLPKDYAFSYSMYKTEPLVLFFPKIYGGSSGKEEFSQESSKAVAAYQQPPSREIADALSKQGALPNPMGAYWGGIGGTSGPPYAGAILVALAIMGFFLIDKQYKWWMLTAFIFTCMISWGSYFDGFNTFLYNSFPFFNKFRAPSMIMVVPQLLITTMAALGLHKVVSEPKPSDLWKSLKNGGLAVGSIIVLAILFYMFADFKSVNELEITKAMKDVPDPNVTGYINDIIKGLVADRKGLALNSILRSLAFAAVAFGALFVLVKGYLKSKIVIPILGVLAFIDVATISNKYLNEENYQDKDDKAVEFVATAKDNEILADKSDYRVLNYAGNRFAESATSYLYRSVGGYHSAKLSNYQDLINRQLSGKNNMGVINMLNVKYFIQKDEKEKTVAYEKNNGALGSAWFVKTISYVKDADAEMKAIDNFNPKDTAIIQEAFKSTIPFAIETDTAATITLDKNDNDKVTYTAKNAKNAFAVFSEMYYKSGWKAYVDGKEQPIAKVNYVLRGLALAPGNHKIEFKFMPEGYKKGTTYATAANVVIILSILGLCAYLFMQQKKKA